MFLPLLWLKWHLILGDEIHFGWRQNAKLSKHSHKNFCHFVQMQVMQILHFFGVCISYVMSYELTNVNRLVLVEINIICGKLFIVHVS